MTGLLSESGFLLGNEHLLNPLDVAAGLDFLELLSEAVEPLGNRAEPLIGHGLQFDGPQVLDLELVFAAPFNERGLGDIQLGGEPRKGPALRASSINRSIVFSSCI